MSTAAFMPYTKKNTFFNRMDPRVKLALLALMVITPILYIDVIFLAVLVLGLILIATIAQIKFNIIFQFIKPILPLFMFLIIFDMFYSSWGTETFFSVGGISLYKYGAIFGLAMVLRMLTMVIASSIVIITTDPASVILALRGLGAPDKLAFMFSTAFRFVPTLMGKALLIQDAQKSRGLRSGNEAGNIFKRVGAMIPIVIPLFIAALELAQKLSLAMESRGFGASDHITYSHDLSMKFSDYIILWIIGILGVIFIILRIIGFGSTLLGTYMTLFRF